MEREIVASTSGRDTTMARAHPARTPEWVALLLLAGPLSAWHERIAHDLARVPQAPAWLGTPACTWTLVAGVVAAALIEAGFYGMLWAARGHRLPLATSAWALLQLSMLDWFAFWLAERAPAGAGSEAWRVVLLGARALGASHGAWAAVCGSLGALTLARMAGWAGAMAALVRRPWREAATLVAGVWIASHVAQGWLLELLRGRSVLP